MINHSLPRFIVALAALILGSHSATAVALSRPMIDAPSGYNLIVVGDPQPQTEEQIVRLEEEILPHIAAIVEEYATADEVYPTAILLTGDVVWDTMEFLERVKKMFESLDVAVYAVIGNHDHAADVVDDEPLAQSYYEEVFGSRNYSFRLGNTHFFALDNIAYTSHDDYRTDVNRRQLRWLRRAMRQTPKEARVAVLMHAPAADYREGGKPLKYAERIIDIVGDRELHFITGHRHRHATGYLAPNVVEHSVAQVSGNLWFAPICSDGTPRGVFLVEERDNVVVWQHRLLGASRDCQIVAYDEGVVADNKEYVVAKIVGWDEQWSVEWEENGVSRGAMEQIEILDPDYMRYVEQEADYDDIIMKRLRASAYPHRHYFRCRRTSPQSRVTIVAHDRFGRTYRCTIGE